jgi:hypothetical protein
LCLSKKRQFTNDIQIEDWNVKRKRSSAIVENLPTMASMSPNFQSKIISSLDKDEPDLDFQVVTGTVQPITLCHKALVVSEGWPSWTFALDGLGFHSVSTIATFDSLSSRGEFLATSFGSSLLRHRDFEPWLHDNANMNFVFVQGSHTFITSVLQQLQQFDNVNIVCAYTSDVDSISCDWLETHANAGGVTNGMWSFETHNFQLPFVEQHVIRRTLKHVLRTTEGASSTFSMKQCLNPPFTPSNRVDWGDSFPRVLTYSVFDKNAPVTRLITIDELLDIYDMELHTQAELHRFWSQQSVKPTRSFVRQIPIKVLRNIGCRVVAYLTPDDDDTSMLSADSDATIVTNHLSSATNLDIDVGDTTLPDDDSIDGSIAAALDSDTESAAPVSSSARADKAARSDDAEADAEDWDIWTVNNFVHDPGVTPLICTGSYSADRHGPLFASLRSLLLRRYRKNILQSFLKYMKTEYYPKKRRVFCINRRSLSVAFWTGIPRHQASLKRKKQRSKVRLNSELIKDLEIGCDAVARAANSSWWNWDAGSTLFFWRWPRWSKSSVRDGIKLFVDWDRMPSFWKRQQWPSDTHCVAKLRKKLSNVRGKQYVQPGFVKSLTSYFAVPKAKTDIRVVYDATACGLNDALWAPNFHLPTVDSVLRNASSDTWFGDIDLGEMFLNYPLDEDIRPFAGVDVSNVDPDELFERGVKRIIERWARCLMGFKPSPYVTTQTFGWSEEVVIGDRLDMSNPFFWDEVKLNLPGTESYNPALPWVYRWNSASSKMAAFFETYIDDIRGGGATEIDCRSTIHRAASRINYLGQQDAPRKRGHATQTPRAWAGAKCEAIPGEGLYVLCMKEKWDKAKTMISKLYQLVVVENNTLLNYKDLERDVGFLCHVSRTYPNMFPYLKGIYNTLNNWRCDRDKDGWKISRTAWMELLAGDIAFEDEKDILLPFDERRRRFKKNNESTHPEEVTMVPRLKFDLQALKELFSPAEPTLRLVRGESIKCSLFGFGDASGGGFGSSWESNKGISYRFGTWGKDMDNQSSNLRELRNLVDTIDEMVSQGSLSGSELFLFTDNSTAEAAFYNGSSTSEKLFQLVLRLKKLEMHNRAKIHIIHVSGERMKDQGSDGLSRGNINVGVMAGKKMIDFVPIHQNALERSASLKPWLNSFIDKEAEYLNPKDWFIRGHDLDESRWEHNSDGMKLPCIKSGSFIWTPAPCAAEAAIEQLRKARHKRQDSQHLFIVPRLMEPSWRKHLHKAADLIVSIKPGHKAWPVQMHEPLTLAFIFPFIRQKPWQLRGSPQLLALGRQLSGVWTGDEGREGPILRKLWNFQKWIESLPAKLAWRMLQSEQPDQVSHCNPRKRRGSKMEKEKRRKKISNCKER